MLDSQLQSQHADGSHADREANLGGFVSHPLHDEGLDNVALLHIVEIIQRDTALHAGAHFADIVLEAAQRTDLAGMHHHVVAQKREPANRA